METFRRETVGATSILHLYECPRALIAAAVDLSTGDATVENFTPHHDPQWFPLAMPLVSGHAARVHMVRNVSLDVHLRREEFLECLEFFDHVGVYAVFSRTSPLKFRATSLPAAARYGALGNFGWSLELAIPGGSSSGWGSIASPDAVLIQRLHEMATGHHDTCATDQLKGH